MKTVTAHTYQNEYEITKTFFFLKNVFMHPLLILVESESHKWLLKAVVGWNHFNGILPNGNKKLKEKFYLYRIGFAILSERSINLNKPSVQYSDWFIPFPKKLLNEMKSSVANAWNATFAISSNLWFRVV